MHLINTRTLQLHHFISEANVKYAILSHRWEVEEVSFEDMKSLAIAKKKKKGFLKIEQCCSLALKRGLDYAWVDTCCINKESSAELSEAINSMFRWYQKSAVCFVYLYDVKGKGDELWTQFASSVWFKRGWTLQELLAPSEATFYDKTWQRIGTKRRLAQELSKTSRIPVEVLKKPSTIFEYSIAQRMHWAAGRSTARAEDRAYSLMGLFGVNMPMLYGEGDKAFVRLQEEIIKHSVDHSIFAWKGITSAGSGLLAASPDHFADNECSTMTVHEHLPIPSSYNTEPYSITNIGVSISLRLTPWKPGTYAAWLACRSVSNPHAMTPAPMIIFLERIQGSLFRRVLVPDFGDRCGGEMSPRPWSEREFRMVQVHVQQHSPPAWNPDLSRPSDLFYGIRILPVVGTDMSRCVWTRCEWDAENGLITLDPGHSGIAATIGFENPSMPKNSFIIGLNFNFRPTLVIFTEDSSYTASADPELWLPQNIPVETESRALFVLGLFQVHMLEHGVYGFEMPMGVKHTSIHLRPVTIDNGLVWPVIRIKLLNFNGQRTWTFEYHLDTRKPNFAYALDISSYPVGVHREGDMAVDLKNHNFSSTE